METEKQTHPPVEFLAAFALGKLPADQAARMQAHLADCPTCHQIVSKTPRETFSVLLAQAGASRPDRSTPGLQAQGTKAWAGQSKRARAESSLPSLKSMSSIDRPPPAIVETDIPQALRQQTKYVIERLLGRGGMGSVYQAHHVAMDRQVAIKVILPSFLDHPEAIERFNREIRAAARLDHPNVARALDADQFGDLRALVMEFVPGNSLDRVLDRHGPLPIANACHYVMQAARGLAHAHDKGMVHRDLKPQNLLLTPKGQIKILDFGLASLGESRRASGGLTRENAILGTPHYMAPEQAMDAKAADIRADIYSLGCTLYCLLTGNPPFVRQTDMGMILAHLNDAARPLIEVRPEVPRALSDLVARMLAKDPADRPQTPAELVKLLAPFSKAGAAASEAKEPEPIDVIVEAPTPKPAKSKLSSKKKKAKGEAAGWTKVIAGALAVPLVGILLAMGLTKLQSSTRKEEGQPGQEAKLAAAAKSPEATASVIPVPAAKPAPPTSAPPAPGSSSPAPAPIAAQPPKTTTPSPAPALVPIAMQKFPQAQVRGGDWHVEGEELVQSDSSGIIASLSFGDVHWSAYNLTLQVRGENPFRDSAAIFVGFSSDRQGRSRVLDLRPSKQTLWSVVPQPGATPDEVALHQKMDLQIRKQAEFQSDATQWHDVRVEVRGTHCECFVDGQKLFMDDDAGFPAGAISIGSSEVVAHFRRIRVTAADGKTTLWEGFPRLPDGSAPKDQSSSAAPSQPAAGSSKSVSPVETSDPPPDGNARRINLLSKIDPARDAIEGKWRFELGILYCPNGVWSRLSLPVDITGPYKLTLEVFVPPDHMQLGVGAVVQGHQCVAALDLPPGEESRIKWSQFNHISGLPGLQSRTQGNRPTARFGQVFKGGSWNTVIVSTTHNSIRVSANGNTVLHWEGDPNNLSVPDNWESPANRLFIGGLNTEYRFSKIELEMADEDSPASRVETPRVETPAATTPATRAENEFVPLFNGQNLDGWRVYPGQPNAWSVKRGVLIGQGTQPSHLFTAAEDYVDVHVRATVRINATGNSGIIVRTPFRAGFLGGYEVQVCARTDVPDTTGSIYAPDGDRQKLMSMVRDHLTRPAQWFDVQIIMKGNEVKTYVNGVEVARYQDPNPRPPGCIALQVHDNRTKVEFKRIEAKRL